MKHANGAYNSCMSGNNLFALLQEAILTLMGVSFELTLFPIPTDAYMHIVLEKY